MRLHFSLCESVKPLDIDAGQRPCSSHISTKKKTKKKHVFDGKTGHQKVFMSQNVIVLEP